MVVAPLFDDDVDMEVAWVQHHVYPAAVSIVVSQCNAYAAFAQRLLDDADHRDWGTVRSYDHSTLQDAHDLLAAAWRFRRHDLRQPRLPLEDLDKDAPGTVQRLWRDWLSRETAGWIDYPDHVRLVQLILTNQNELPGHIAEWQLSLAIISRFDDVPWYEEKRKACEANLAKWGLEPDSHWC